MNKDKLILELQARIDKAIKYIKEKKDVPEWWDTDFIVLLSILKGTNFRTELDKYDE